MLCVTVTADGHIVLPDVQPSVCDYWIGQGADYALWQVPPNEDLIQMFGGGFALVLVGFLAGWAVGRVVNFLS